MRGGRECPHQELSRDYFDPVLRATVTEKSDTVELVTATGKKRLKILDGLSRSARTSYPPPIGERSSRSSRSRLRVTSSTLPCSRAVASGRSPDGIRCRPDPSPPGRSVDEELVLGDLLAGLRTVARGGPVVE